MPAPLERIDLRTSTETKALIARAAAIDGMSVSASLLTAAQERAKAVLSKAEFITLTQSDWGIRRRIGQSRQAPAEAGRGHDTLSLRRLA